MTSMKVPNGFNKEPNDFNEENEAIKKGALSAFHYLSLIITLSCSKCFNVLIHLRNIMLHIISSVSRH